MKTLGGFILWTTTTRRSRLLTRRMQATEFGGIFQLAKKMAECSTYGNFRHGAVLCRSSSIIGYGINSEKYSSIGSKFRADNKGVSTYHAEISAIMNLPREVIKGSTIYVARVSKGSKEDRLSKPCSMCYAVLKSQGVKKVYYTVDDQNVGFYKIT